MMFKRQLEPSKVFVISNLSLMYEEQPQKRKQKRGTIEFERKWTKVMNRQFGGRHKKPGKCLHGFT